MMGFKDFQAVSLRRPIAGPDTGKRVAKITPTVTAIILGYTQMQGHDPIALAGVL